jgi:voltage-gated potassium channel
VIFAIDRALLRELYYGNTPRGHWFRYGLLASDLAMISSLVVFSFYADWRFIGIVDAVFGLIILLDLTARLAMSRNRFRELLHPATVADILVVVSLLGPIVGEGLAFLRVLRLLRLLRSYRVMARLRRDVAFVRRNEDVLLSVLHLVIFLFLMTGIVYETQRWSNPQITNYLDALYFTVTTLTTTGFGDITLVGSSGRLVAVLIMIFGVSLFIRLAQVIFRPHKIRYECPDCGLERHDADAVHCKHCGRVLHIEAEGQG